MEPRKDMLLIYFNSACKRRIVHANIKLDSLHVQLKYFFQAHGFISLCYLQKQK